MLWRSQRDCPRVLQNYRSCSSFMINKCPRKMVHRARPGPCPQPESCFIVTTGHPAAAASDMNPAYTDQVSGIPPEEETLFTPPPKALASVRASRGYTGPVCHHSDQFWTIPKLNYNKLTPIWQPVSKYPLHSIHRCVAWLVYSLLQFWQRKVPSSESTGLACCRKLPILCTGITPGP